MPVKIFPLHLVIVHLVLIGVFGILLPWRKGIDFLDPVMISAYACLGVLFAGPASAYRFSKDRPQSMRQALARISKAVAYGEGMCILMLIAGIVTVNTGRTGRTRLPELDVLGEAFLFGLFTAIALAISAAWVTLRFSAGIARTSLRAVFLFAVLALFYWPARLPEITLLPGLPLAIGVAAGMTWLLHRQVSPR